MGLLPDDALGAAVAPLRERPAELVDHLVTIEPHAQGVIAHVTARVHPFGPAGQVVLFQALPELRAELGLEGELREGDAAALAGGAKDGAEGFLVEMHVADRSNFLSNKFLRKNRSVRPGHCRNCTQVGHEITITATWIPTTSSLFCAAADPPLV